MKSVWFWCAKVQIPATFGFRAVADAVFSFGKAASLVLKYVRLRNRLVSMATVNTKWNIFKCSSATPPLPACSTAFSRFRIWEPPLQETLQGLHFSQSDHLHAQNAQRLRVSGNDEEWWRYNRYIDEVDGFLHENGSGWTASKKPSFISFIWLFGLEVCTLHSMCAHGFSTHSIFISQLKCEWHPERPAIRAQVAALLWLRGVKAGPIWWLGNDGPTPSLGAIAEGLTRRPSGPVAVPVGRHWSPITKWYGFAMFHFRYEPWSVRRRLGQNHRN